MWIGLGTSHYYEGVRGDCCRPGLWFAAVSPHWAVLIFNLFTHLSPEGQNRALCSCANGAVWEGPALVSDLVAPPAASQVQENGPVRVTAVCPSTAAGSPTSRSMSDCHDCDRDTMPRQGYLRR